MGCIIMRMEKLEEKVEALEKKAPSVTYTTTNDKPKLASAIYFAAFMALFITGLLLHWHWGWLTAIGIFGVGVSASVAGGI